MYTCACTVCIYMLLCHLVWLDQSTATVHVHVHVIIHVHVYLTNSAFYIIRPEI